MSFTYFHCYLPETWEGQVNCGLIDGNAGIRFCQTVTVREEYKFNRLAARDGELWNLLREQRLPFYIDRLQGGCYMDEYPYDRELVQAYRELLGDRFFGFQMHEWMNNLRADIRKLDRGGCTDWTVPNIEATISRLYPGKHLFLEAMTAGEYAAAGRPDTIEAFLDLSRALLERRLLNCGGDLITCDSSSLSYPIEVAAGVRRTMPEIGAQTPDTRVQMAFTRGMAKAYGMQFGAYLEPWSGKPATACCYHREGKNEWGCTARISRIRQPEKTAEAPAPCRKECRSTPIFPAPPLWRRNGGCAIRFMTGRNLRFPLTERSNTIFCSW